ncbi:MAG: CopG family transcriptional regulator [Candidatus Thorarchaeota archaeon]
MAKGKKRTGKFTSVSVPVPLFNKIEERIEGTGFTSVSSYVTYVLREIIANREEEDTENPFTKEDEKKVKDRLKALGYLD